MVALTTVKIPGLSILRCSGRLTEIKGRSGINQIPRIALASPAFISIRSPDRGRKAILTVHRGIGASRGIRAGDTRALGGFFRARDGCA